MSTYQILLSDIASKNSSDPLSKPLFGFLFIDGLNFAAIFRYFEPINCSASNFTGTLCRRRTESVLPTHTDSINCSFHRRNGTMLYSQQLSVNCSLLPIDRHSMPTFPNIPNILIENFSTLYCHSDVSPFH